MKKQSWRLGVLIVLAQYFTWVEFAFAKGGGSFAPIGLFVAIIAAVVMPYLLPALAPGLTGALGYGVALGETLSFGAFAMGVVTSVALDAALCFGGGVSSDASTFQGCGGGGGDSGENNSPPPGSNPILSTQYTSNTSATSGGSGGTLMCPSGYSLCGTTSCIPEGEVCCASAGYTDRYCPANSICRTDGQCEQGTGGSNCVANRGQVCTGAQNSCGMSNNDFFLCDGSCPVISPADSSCPVPVITLTVTPAFINPDESCTVSWSTTNTTSCTVSGPGAPTSTSTSGSFVTPPLSAATNYVVHCNNGTVVTGQLTAQCRINPAFEED
jgi:hypothetical protein